VSAKLRQKVAAVKGLVDRAEPLASMLRSGNAEFLAVLVADVDKPFATSIVSAVEHGLDEHPYEVVAAMRGDEAIQRADCKAALARPPAGLIVLSCRKDFAGRRPSGPQAPRRAAVRARFWSGVIPIGVVAHCSKNAGSRSIQSRRILRSATRAGAHEGG
jgi:hypothetical protein